MLLIRALALRIEELEASLLPMPHSQNSLLWLYLMQGKQGNEVQLFVQELEEPGSVNRQGAGRGQAVGTQPSHDSGTIAAGRPGGGPDWDRGPLGRQPF